MAGNRGPETTARERRQWREWRAEGLTITEIAERAGRSRNCVRKHTPAPKRPAVTDQEVERWRRMEAAGHSRARIAKTCKRHRTTIAKYLGPPPPPKSWERKSVKQRKERIRAAKRHLRESSESRRHDRRKSRNV